jgi:hypothetical protein
MRDFYRDLRVRIKFHWFVKWLYSCYYAFSAAKASARYRKEMESRPPPPPPQEMPPRGYVIRPKTVEQNGEITERVSEIMFGMRDPTKKVKDVVLSLNYDDGSASSFTWNEPVMGLHTSKVPGHIYIEVTTLEGMTWPGSA